MCTERSGITGGFPYFSNQILPGKLSEQLGINAHAPVLAFLYIRESYCKLPLFTGMKKSGCEALTTVPVSHACAGTEMEHFCYDLYYVSSFIWKLSDFRLQ